MADVGAENGRLLLVSLVLALVGGFADAGSYVLVSSFTGHITGNSIMLMVHLVNSQWPEALSCLIAAAAFLAGTAGGVNWPYPAGRSACRRLAPALVLEIALITAGMIVPALPGTGRKDVFLASLCLALGLQNGMLGKVGLVGVHTTFITGLSTTLVKDLVTGTPGPKREVLLSVIGCFILGALAGAWALTRFGIAAFSVVLALLAFAWLLAVTTPATEGLVGPGAPGDAREP